MATAPPQIPGLDEWRPLARGGFALVWEARQQTLDRRVAVKVDERSLNDLAEQRRFLREAGAAGRMSGHPGIVTVHDAGILPDDRPYLVMELCPAGSLTRWLKPEHRPTPQRVRRVGVQLADALAAAHARGVLHRDVKPANVLLDSFDNVGLADFGLAMVPGPDTELTGEVLEALTPAYAPPEALRMEPATERGDVFSLAATLYALLAGRPPRNVDTHTQTVAEVVETVAEPIAPLPDVDPALMDVLMRALSDDPRQRPTAAEFRDQLAALDLGERTGSSALLPAGEAAASRRGRRLLVGLLALLVSGALAAVLLPTLNQSPGSVIPGPAAANPSANPPGAGAPTGPEPTPPEPTPPEPTPAEPTPAEPTDPVTGSTGSPTPSTAPPPAGFVDCSDALGAGALCPKEPECWGGVFSYRDSPRDLPMADCSQTHQHQTFVAGVLSEDVRRQSELDALDAVRDLCNRRTLRKLLVSERAEDFDALAIPPQADVVDNLFRCVAGPAERDFPFELEVG